MRVSYAAANSDTVPPPELPVMAIRFQTTPWCPMAQSMRRDMSHTRSQIGVRSSSRSHDTIGMPCALPTASM